MKTKPEDRLAREAYRREAIALTRLRGQGAPRGMAPTPEPRWVRAIGVGLLLAAGLCIGAGLAGMVWLAIWGLR